MDARYTKEQMLVLEKQMITCKDVVGLFGDYTDGCLPPTLKARVDEHLTECSGCQEFSRDYLLGIKLARELSDSPVPAGVNSRLREALNRRLGISLPSSR